MPIWRAAMMSYYCRLPFHFIFPCSREDTEIMSYDECIREVPAGSAISKCHRQMAHQPSVARHGPHDASIAYFRCFALKQPAPTLLVNGRGGLFSGRAGWREDTWHRFSGTNTTFRVGGAIHRPSSSEMPPAASHIFAARSSPLLIVAA